MGKFIKYEIKGTYKFILGIIAILIIASTIIQLSADIQLSVGKVGGEGALPFFLLVLPALVIFAAYITAFFYIIGGFRKELYEDRGYLTFSLPLSGNQILGAKIFVAALWFFLIGASVAVYNIIVSMVLYIDKWIFELKDAIKMMGEVQIGTFIIIFALSCITILTMIYFSIALSRVTIKNKKIGNLWFVIFLVMSSLFNYFLLEVSRLMPYYIDFGHLKIASYNELTNFYIDAAFSFPILPGNTPGEFYVGIPALILTIVTFAGMFLGTSYLIEKKIDL